MHTNYPRHIPAFAYVGCHQYFLTFCTNDRARLFTSTAAVDVVWAQFLRAGIDESMAILACCFMPDHVHLLVEGESEASDVKRFISRAKQSTRSVMAYILENPLRAGLVASVREYSHLRSSRLGVNELIDYACCGPAGAGHPDESG